MNFKTVEQDIRPILEASEIARADDMALYTRYARRKIKSLNLGAGWIEKVFSNRNFRILYGIAPYDTVSRVRRRLQAENKDLRPSKEYIEERKKAERDYREYAKRGGGNIE